METNMENKKQIRRFKGEYSFLGNFFPVPVRFEGITYPSSEHAFQAAKFSDIEVRKGIAKRKAAKEAKLFTRGFPSPLDWDERKVEVMKTILFCKFTQNPKLSSFKNDRLL